MTANRLIVNISAVTPLFIGGAFPNEFSELRPQSFKGLLRYWYRALDGEYRSREDCFFGSTDAGQSACLLQIRRWDTGNVSFSAGRPDQNAGLNYLGYSLNLGDNHRKSIREGTSFRLEIIPRPSKMSEEEKTRMRRAWLGSLWLLTHVGGIGTRSRRGFGSLRIDNWQGWPECQELPLPCRESSPQGWNTAFAGAFRRLRSGDWFPQAPDVRHTAFTSEARPVLHPREFRTWQQALDFAGQELRDFRIGAGPERAGFGLPIAFRNPSLRRYGDLRMASPLFIRIFRLGNNYHAAFIKLPAPFPPDSGNAWPDGADKVIDTFLNNLGRGRPS